MNQSYKNTFLTSLGSALEYYDFVTYIMLANILSVVFFAHEDPWARRLVTLAVFATGYLIRPLGGIIFGRYADKMGRKKAFLVAIALMGLATLCIGLLPSYQTIGITSILLLLILRLLQGLSQGAELPGAITIICESIQQKDRSLGAGLLMMTVGLGAMLSSFVNYVLNSLLTPNEMIHFGWRIPFLIGGGLAIVAFYARRLTQETPAFLKIGRNARRTPLKNLIKSHWRKIILGLGVMLFPSCFIIFGLFIPSYANTYFQFPKQSVYLALTIGLLWTSILLPLAGLIADRIGRKLQMTLLSFIAIVVMYSLFNLLSHPHPLYLYAFALLYQTIIACVACCFPAILSELFPTEVRYSGVGLCYNIAYTIAAATPFVATIILHYNHNRLSISLLFAILAFVSLVTLMCTNARNEKQALDSI